jgi:hypothetical protein
MLMSVSARGLQYIDQSHLAQFQVHRISSLVGYPWVTRYSIDSNGTHINSM